MFNDNIATALAAYLQSSFSDPHTAHCHLVGNGPVAAFEEKIANWYGAKHALCVDSVTNGLMYLCLSTGLRNREIATSPLSYGATIAGAMWLGNTFHFTALDPTLNLDPQSLRDILLRHPKIKAVFAVDFAGIPHDVRGIREVCDEFGVWYFADAAQSLGAITHGEPASSLADAWVVSFSPGKTLSCGEGAAILTNDTELYNELVLLTQHPHRMKRDVRLGAAHELGLNGRMNPMAAIVGNETFEAAMEATLRRQKRLLKLYRTTDQYESVVPWNFDRQRLRPAFYHIPMTVRDPALFQQEFTETAHYQASKATFVTLPEQLRRFGEKSAVRSTDHESEVVAKLSELYLLHEIIQKPKHHGTF